MFPSAMCVTLMQVHVVPSEALLICPRFSPPLHQRSPRRSFVAKTRKSGTNIRTGHLRCKLAWYVVSNYLRFPFQQLICAQHELLGHGCGKLLQETEPGKYNFDVNDPPTSPITGKPVTKWYKPGETWGTVFGGKCPLSCGLRSI